MLVCLCARAGELQPLINDIGQSKQQVRDFAATVVIVGGSVIKGVCRITRKSVTGATDVLIGHGEKREIRMRVEVTVFVSKFGVMPATRPIESFDEANVLVSEGERFICRASNGGSA